MSQTYQISKTTEIFSPALVVFTEVLDANIAEMVRVAGDVNRLRPHCKTHKMPEVVKRQLDMGITKHKAATFAEAEMLADTGVKDIFLAYNLVGPNIGRAVAFCRKYPDVKFAVTADDTRMLAQLSEAMTAASTEIDVLLDCDSGLHRTGKELVEEAAALYQQIADSPGVNPGGLHFYDGHHHQVDFEERKSAVLADFQTALDFREQLQQRGLDVPKIVAGGTGSFPVYAGVDDQTVELSPGTCVLHDCGYGTIFPDLNFQPAAMMLTRVISRPTPNRLTVDLGNKSIAADPPMGNRVMFPDLPDAEQVLHNEEHLVLETPLASKYQPGDELLGIPRHICPTSALHRQAYVVENGELIGRWDVVARDRQITI
ncbi:D-TA family PLP-dependent enzyme [Thalassoroseus pseudoceratinae]|uniref:D-TA family PLP-dependent enzyme n=1 Tax=Thalassoroseus pseudoceratinae TaxID=2713176 RepID=UPI00141DAC19|nr:D-TA family PLP-dependent enzyme [Thalassoroseus pseudoceratinae]